MTTKLISLLALALAVAVPAKAQLLLAPSRGTGFLTTYPGLHNLGFQFTVGDSPLLVDALGFYDVGLNGLTESHSVGLWQLDGSLLASVTISAGTYSLVNGFAFEPLPSPTLLAAHTDYILSAFWLTNADGVSADFLSGSSPLLNGATLVGSRNTLATSTLGFSFPDRSGGSDGFMWLGPNLSFTSAAGSPVPEPAAFGAVGALFLIGVARLASGRRKAARLSDVRSEC